MVTAHSPIGFIGLGSQGGPMARRIIEDGFPMIIWGRRPEALEPFRGSNVQVAESITDLARHCAIVAVCVVDDIGVRDIAEILIREMNRGGLIVVHSTVHPQTCVDLAAKAREHGLSLIDAPVSGGGQGAAARTLTVMIGGESGDVDRARPMMETFAGMVLHLGPVGAGQHAKLINNALMAANMALAEAALSVGNTLAIDQRALIELINGSSGRSYGFEVRARLPDIAMFEHGARLLSKDVGLLSELLKDPGVETLRAAAAPFLSRIVSGPRCA